MNWTLLRTIALLSVALPFCVKAHPIATAPEELSLELYEPGSVPPWTWTRSDSHYDLKVIEGGVSEGKRLIKIAPRMQEPRAGFVTFDIDASAYAEKGFEIQIPFRTEGFYGENQGVAVWYRIDEKFDSDGRDKQPLSISLSRGNLYRAAEWGQIVLSGVAPKEAHHFHIGLIPVGQGTILMDSIRVVAMDEDVTRSLKTLSSDERDYLVRALDTLRTESLYKEANWDEIVRRAFIQAEALDGMNGVYQSITTSLMAINDRHSSFLRPSQAKAYSTSTSKWRRENSSVDSEGIGYLRLDGYVGSAPEAQLKYANDLRNSLETMREKVRCGWIVDLSNNRGGNMWPQLAGLAPLFDGEVVGEFSYPQGLSEKWTVTDTGIGVAGKEIISIATSRDESNWDLPVVVVIGSATASSGEALAIAFTGRNHTFFIGGKSIGLTSATMYRPLSDGAALVFSTSWMANRNGNRFESGIDPSTINSHLCSRATHLCTDATGWGPGEARHAAAAVLRAERECSE